MYVRHPSMVPEVAQMGRGATWPQNAKVVPLHAHMGLQGITRYDWCAHTFMSAISIAATYCYWL